MVVYYFNILVLSIKYHSAVCCSCCHIGHKYDGEHSGSDVFGTHEYSIHTVGQISIWYNRKIELNIWYRYFVYNCRGQMFPVVITEGRRLLAKISRYMAPSILPSIRCSRPVPFAEKHPQSMIFHPHASWLGWCSWDCTHPSSSSKHGEWRFYQKVLFWSHLTTQPSPMPPLDHPDGIWQTSDGPGLEQGDLARAAGF